MEIVITEKQGNIILKRTINEKTTPEEIAEIFWQRYPYIPDFEPRYHREFVVLCAEAIRAYLKTHEIGE